MTESGVHLDVGLLLFVAAIAAVIGAMWLGRKNSSELLIYRRTSPLAFEADMSLAPMWELLTLNAGMLLFAGELAALALAFGWVGVIAGVVCAIVLRNICARRAVARVYNSMECIRLRHLTRRTLLEAAVLALGWLLLFTAGATIWL